MAKTKEVQMEVGRETDVCCLLFKQVEKPKNYMMCKAMNVYDNKYRINVYTKHEEEGLFKQSISNSYFAKLN